MDDLRHLFIGDLVGNLSNLPSEIVVGEDITAGPDGNLWFTESNKIGRISPNGTITEFPIPKADHDLGGFAVGPNDHLWFTESNNNKIGYITSGR